MPRLELTDAEKLDAAERLAVDAAGLAAFLCDVPAGGAAIIYRQAGAVDVANVRCPVANRARIAEVLDVMAEAQTDAGNAAMLRQIADRVRTEPKDPRAFWLVVFLDGRRVVVVPAMVAEHPRIDEVAICARPKGEA